MFEYALIEDNTENIENRGIMGAVQDYGKHGWRVIGTGSDRDGNLSYVLMERGPTKVENKITIQHSDGKFTNETIEQLTSAIAKHVKKSAQLDATSRGMLHGDEYAPAKDNRA